MGKRKHIKSGAGDVVTRPGPLDAQIESEKLARKREQPRGILKKPRLDTDDVVNEKLTNKILKLATKQREEGDSDKEEVDNDDDAPKDEDQESFEEDFDDDEEEDFEEDEEESQATNDQSSQNADFSKASDIENPHVIQMYREIGEYMARYRSGKIPKAFKSIPALLNWEQILELTCPEKYTAASMLHATRLFAATASPKVCERFYRYYLLPRVLDDIMEFRKLNVHLFAALKKAAYKPVAFVKGIVVPLCASDTFSLNAAHVLRGVLNSVSLPVFHAAAAMIKISQLPISSPVSYVLTGLIYKRYNLPSMVVDALLKYFKKFEEQEEELMPLSLNSCVHAFVQLYKLELSDEQRAQLVDLMKTRGHKLARQLTLKELDNLNSGVVTQNIEGNFQEEMEE